MKKTLLHIGSAVLSLLLCLCLTSCSAIPSLILLLVGEDLDQGLENGFYAPSLANTPLYEDSSMRATLQELKQHSPSSIEVAIEYTNLSDKELTVRTLFLTVNGYTLSCEESISVSPSLTAPLTKMKSYILRAPSAEAAELIGSIGEYGFSFAYEYDILEPLFAKGATVKTAYYDKAQNAPKPHSISLLSHEALSASLLQRTREKDSYFECFFALTNTTSACYTVTTESVLINSTEKSQFDYFDIAPGTTVLVPLRLHQSTLESMGVRSIESVSLQLRIVDDSLVELLDGSITCRFNTPITLEEKE